MAQGSDLVQLAATVTVLGSAEQAMEGEKKTINQALWLECAGPLITLPAIGSQVVYFPQGHSEQVIASTQKEGDVEIPSYPNLPPQLFCQLHNITLHADQENDEVFAQMTLQPLQQNVQLKDPFLLPDLGIQPKQTTISFSKTLTASDTSTHGGFSIPRRAAEKVFPPLDFNKTPPAQELVATDLHNTEWHFRHIYRGQPRRHLLTTGWSVFVSAKRLQAGDTVLFLRDEQGRLMLGIRRANRQQANLPTSLLSSDSMLIGVLAAAAHAASTNSRFTIFYNPRASPSEFVIPLAKYQKALHPPHVTVGMRFRMEMETEDSSTRRYMGTITGIGDLDPIRWPHSYWRSLKVGWDESTAGQRQRRVSAWEIEPLTAPFLLCNSSFLLRSKRLRPNEEEMDMKRPPSIWARGEEGKFNMHGLTFPGATVDSWLRKPDGPAEVQHNFYSSMAAAALQEMRSLDGSKQLQAPAVDHFQQMQYGALSAGPQMLQPQAQSASQHHQQQQVLPNLSEAAMQSSYQGAYNMSALKASSTSGQPDLASSFTLQNMLGRQNSEGIVVEENVTYSSMLQGNNQGGVQKQPSMTPSSSWVPSLRDHVDPAVLNATPTVPIALPRIETGTPLASSQQSQFLFREGTADQEGDPRSHLLFGVNIDGRLGIQNDSAPFSSPSFSKGKEVQAPFSASMLASPSNAAATDASRSALMVGDELQQGWQQGGYPPPVRTFTKVHKVGSVGRSLDMTRFKNYNDLRNELAKMFGLEGQLDTHKSGWQVVFIDNENDMLLLGDDPWEEFIGCVKSIRILSPSEVLQMRQEQLDWLNSIPVQQRQATSSCSDECVTRQQQQQEQQTMAVAAATNSNSNSNSNNNNNNNSNLTNNNSNSNHNHNHNHSSSNLNKGSGLRNPVLSNYSETTCISDGV